MNHSEIVEALTSHVPSGLALDENDVDSLRHAVRTAFEFQELLESISADDTITINPERLRALFLDGLRKIDLTAAQDNLRPVAETLLSEDRDPFETIESANETTVSGEGMQAAVRDALEQMAGDKFPIPLKWTTYGSVLELKREFNHHFAVLRSPETEPRKRVHALMNTMRLRLTFFANTFCRADESV
ncbi:MAG: hypothetical protein WBG86_19115 [Polyangiales bacterium]